jgi:DNA invertase Pin-like site-specific DNA recombinase
MALEEFRSLNIDFVSHQEALDTSTPMGKATFTIIAAMAEWERNVIRERVIAGLDYAQAHGTKSGKPVGSWTLQCARLNAPFFLPVTKGYPFGTPVLSKQNAYAMQIALSENTL